MSNSLILVVEDNPDILYNTKLTLEINNYDVLTAKNGVEALNELKKLNTPPNLILSDIMMPKLGGYDFFKIASKNSEWSNIPFIFVTARSSPEDVRLAKMLGADDFFIKPINEDDLLGTISTKINRSRKLENIVNTKINKGFEFPLKINIDEFIMLLLESDIDEEPIIKKKYTNKDEICMDLFDIGKELFQISFSLPKPNILEPQGFLLKVDSINQFSYIYFDIIEGVGNEIDRIFMLGIIAPKISYYSSLKLKSLFKIFAFKIKQKNDLDFSEYKEEIKKILNI